MYLNIYPGNKIKRKKKAERLGLFYKQLIYREDMNKIKSDVAPLLWRSPKAKKKQLSGVEACGCSSICTVLVICQTPMNHVRDRRVSGSASAAEWTRL